MTYSERERELKMVTLENVAIANALQLELDDTPIVFRFNYDAMPSLKSLNLSIAVL